MQGNQAGDKLRWAAAGLLTPTTLPLTTDRKRRRNRLGDRQRVRGTALG